jgi:hypothetical protein
MTTMTIFLRALALAWVLSWPLKREGQELQLWLQSCFH